MDKILKGIENVHCYLDDIIIGGRKESHCQSILCQVLEKLNEFHVQINLKKCSFLEKSVVYLGHVSSGGCYH